MSLFEEEELLNSLMENQKEIIITEHKPPYYSWRKSNTFRGHIPACCTQSSTVCAGSKKMQFLWDSPQRESGKRICNRKSTNIAATAFPGKCFPGGRHLIPEIRYGCAACKTGEGMVPPRAGDLPFYYGKLDHPLQ